MLVIGDSSAKRGPQVELVVQQSSLSSLRVYVYLRIPFSVLV